MATFFALLDGRRSSDDDDDEGQRPARLHVATPAKVELVVDEGVRETKPQKSAAAATTALPALRHGGNSNVSLNADLYNPDTTPPRPQRRKSGASSAPSASPLGKPRRSPQTPQSHFSIPSSDYDEADVLAEQDEEEEEAEEDDDNNNADESELAEASEDKGSKRVVPATGPEFDFDYQREDARPRLMAKPTKKQTSIMKVSARKKPNTPPQREVVAMASSEQTAVVDALLARVEALEREQKDCDRQRRDQIRTLANLERAVAKQQIAVARFQQRQPRPIAAATAAPPRTDAGVVPACTNANQCELSWSRAQLVVTILDHAFAAHDDGLRGAALRQRTAEATRASLKKLRRTALKIQRKCAKLAMTSTSRALCGRAAQHEVQVCDLLTDKDETERFVENLCQDFFA